MFRVDVHALARAGQKSAAPIASRYDRIAVCAHRDEGGQVAIFGAEAVGDPGAKAGAWQAPIATVHQHQGRFMVRDFGMHRADNRHVIDVCRGLLEEFADPKSGFSTLLELER